MKRRPARKVFDDVHKAFIVTQYAMYARGHEVLNAFEAEFGFRPEAGVARKYNLTDCRSEDDARKRGVLRWLPLWKKARAEFEANVQDIPIASAVYRVKKLDEMFDIAFQKKNYKSAAQLLEQAAKETGGMFTNKRELNGKVDLTVEEVPDEIKNATLAGRLRDHVIAAVLAEANADSGDPQPTASTKH